MAVAAGCGRKEAALLIRKGLVTADGVLCRAADAKFDDGAALRVNGQELCYRKHIYIMQNKPEGVISATENKRDPRPTVVDILPPELRRTGLFPAGRLDADTTGFVLITDDGEFAHDILAPKKHVCKQYRVETDVEPSADIAERFRDGLALRDGSVCLRAELVRLGPTEFEVTLHEGMYHQIKRMFAACGAKVTRLHRFCIGNLLLDQELAPGQSRLLKEQELQTLTSRR